MNPETQRLQQLEINNRWLLSKFDEVHTALCPDHLGTWQQRVEACVRAAKKLRAPKTDKKQASKLQDDAMHLLSFLNDQCGTKFRHTLGNINLIKARLREKEVTADGVEQMIRRQCEKWKGTEMEQYLRPSTLFRASKFDSYYAAKDLPIDAGNRPKRSFGDLCYEDK